MVVTVVKMIIPNGMTIVTIATALRNKKTKLQIWILIVSWHTIDIFNTICLRARGANYFIHLDIADPVEVPRCNLQSGLRANYFPKQPYLIFHIDFCLV